jgi:dihydrofolate synthase / folylpolyglutamate synthase
LERGSSPAESWLASLDPIGWRFGLDRIRALLAELGHPERAFESAHVVGTNGKSSVTLMTAALLQAHGRRTGACISPHTARWSERVWIDGAEVGAEAFGAAVDRVAGAARVVEARFPAGERITQFEAATAAGFVALAEAGVELGVIEAGLGGRLDATNVLPSRATALTSVGLDHTQWLGDTPLEIAAEKLDVLQPGTILITGRLAPDVLGLAERTAAARGAQLIVAGPAELSPSGSPAAPYLLRNLGVALELARVLIGELDDRAVERALDGLELPGRSQWIAGDPPVLLDAAHNPDGAAALAEALHERAAGRPVVACLAVLADKDAEGIVAALAPALDGAVCCAIPPAAIEGSGRPGSASVPPPELAAVCARHGLDAAPAESPEAGIEAAVGRARKRGGVALIAGSHYLLRYEWIARRAQNSSR